MDFYKTRKNLIKMENKMVGNELKEDILNSNFLDKIKISLSEGIMKQFRKYEKEANKENNEMKQKLDLKIKQLSTAKILVNVHKRNPELLIRSHLELAEFYQKLSYTKQAYEHNRQALKKFYVNFDQNENFSLLQEIYHNLIESCYILKSYNQTLNYINSFYE